LSSSSKRYAGRYTETINALNYTATQHHDVAGRFITEVDPVYNKKNIAELDNSTTFVYDAKDQLIAEHRYGYLAYNTTYTYDGMGNRLQKIDSGAVTVNIYNAANQLMTSTPPTGPATNNSYDNNGNLILQNTGGSLTTYTWDQENRTTVIWTPAGVITTYLYSDEGHRQAAITGTAGGTTTDNYVWDGDVVLQEATASLITQVQYTQGPGEWGLLLAQIRAGGTPQYFGADDRENVRLVMDNLGNILDSNAYKAFLELLDTPTQVNPFFGGGNVGYYQEVISLLRAGARLYNPVTGTWITMDPIDRDGGDENLYRYVMNNPTKWIDPFGLKPFGCVCTCGTDVTHALINTMQKLYLTMYSGGVRALPQSVCDTFVSPEGWDIAQLNENGWLFEAPYWHQPGDIPLCATKCPAAPTDEGCLRTVTVDGACFHAYAVNYVLYGAVFRYCFGSSYASQTAMEDSILAWTGLKYGGVETKEKIAWADAGFHVWPGFAATPHSAAVTACAPTCSVPDIYSVFTIHLSTLADF
jgi:RHS repeat-associated protein